MGGRFSFRFLSITRHIALTIIFFFTEIQHETSIYATRVSAFRPWARSDLEDGLDREASDDRLVVASMRGEVGGLEPLSLLALFTSSSWRDEKGCFKVAMSNATRWRAAGDRTRRVSGLLVSPRPPSGDKKGRRTEAGIGWPSLASWLEKKLSENGEKWSET